MILSLPNLLYQDQGQVYFIDNEEFFSRRGQVKDEDGKEYADNGERAAFFARGVIETIKKLRWTPDVIHCQGWMTSFLPLYIKQAYKDEPAVCNAKIVTSLFNEAPEDKLESNIKDCLVYNDVTLDSLSKYNDEFDAAELTKIAIDNSDGIISTSSDINADALAYAKSSGAKVLECADADFADAYVKFYDSLFE